MVYLRNRCGISKKARRHSGWVTPECTIKAKRQWLVDNCLEPQIFYDEWESYRDGFRDHGDRTKITTCPLCVNDLLFDMFNKKNKKLIQRRKARKYGRVA